MFVGSRRFQSICIFYFTTYSEFITGAVYIFFLCTKKQHFSSFVAAFYFFFFLSFSFLHGTPICHESADILCFALIHIFASENWREKLFKAFYMLCTISNIYTYIHTRACVCVFVYIQGNHHSK